jgi:hypothetical protein
MPARAEMIEALFRSFDSSTPDLDAVWLRESRDRLAAYHAGELPALDGPDTLRAIEAELRR